MHDLKTPVRRVDEVVTATSEGVDVAAASRIFKHDELVTKLRGLKEHVFVWVALDAQTKIMPVIHIGGRRHDDAMGFVHEVWQRLAPGASPVFTTDGLWLWLLAWSDDVGASARCS